MGCQKELWTFLFRLTRILSISVGSRKVQISISNYQPQQLFNAVAQSMYVLIIFLRGARDQNGGIFFLKTKTSEGATAILLWSILPQSILYNMSEELSEVACVQFVLHSLE